jgi:membrane fusion protein, multidrug efflux system
MRKGRVALSLACAGILAGAAYLVWTGSADSLLAALPGARDAKKAPEGKLRSNAAPVTAATVQTADMPVIISAPGTVEPLATVAVRTRVDGQVVEVAFKEGDLVKQGEVLFRLDDRMAKAQIAQAQANIGKDEAGLADAQATLARRETLMGKQVISEAALDQARYAVEGLKASIAAGRAMLDSQKTQLDYLIIRAPITGRTGAIAAKLGATLRAQDANPLVTINQTRPILVSFAVPQTDLPAARRALANKAKARITLPGTDVEPVPGTISFIDNQVDIQTGSIVVKVTAENKEEVLWPGLAVEVALTVEVRKNVPSAPASAVLPAQQGMIAWVIGADNKVAPRVVTIDRIVGQTVFLRSGLKPGERVVTDGQLRLAPGTTVNIEEPRRPPPPVGEDRNVSGRG